MDVKKIGTGCINLCHSLIDLSMSCQYVISRDEFIHNILSQTGTLASPNMQQTRKIKNRNVECMVDPMGPHLSNPGCSWQTPSSHQLQHEQLWDQAQSIASHIQIEFK
jgi:hypothetical protein